MGTPHFHGALVILLLVVPVAQGIVVAAHPLPTDALAVARWEKVDESLRTKAASLEHSAKIEFLIELSDRASLTDVAFRRELAVNRLMDTADAAQARIIPSLAADGFTVKRAFWITNALLVEGPAGRLGDVTRRSDVAKIVENFGVELVDGIPAASPATATGNVTWGVARVGADRVWSDLGARGAGVRVCLSDTGVDLGHPDLAGRMATSDPGNPRFPGGWIEFDRDGDPVLRSRPHDTHGHGTHTSGTVLGGNASGDAIGVAPEATLMHALVLPGGSAAFSQILAGLEWCVRPTDENGDPVGRPADIHSMSWGAPGYVDYLVEPIRNSALAGTLPVAAAGNCRAGCSASPGNVFESLSVGATDEDDLVANFSSGELVRRASWTVPPSEWPNDWTVPAIAAPGVAVTSSVPGGYAAWSGTSMATPHVAGCAALMLSANPGLTTADLRDALITSARWLPTYAPAPPDTRYGHGRLDCLAAVERVAYQGGIRGTIRDGDDGQAVDQAPVRATGVTMNRTAEGDSSGGFAINLKPGVYTVSIDRFGYAPWLASDITVQADEWVTLDVRLAPFPRGSVIGTVSHATSGTPIPGIAVSLPNLPVRISAVTDDGGGFTLQKVPEGPHELRMTSPYFADLTFASVPVVRDVPTTVSPSMQPRPWVAVVGDDGDRLSALLRANGYYVETPDWAQVTADACRYRAVIVNGLAGLDAVALGQFLSATDLSGTGVVFLDTRQLTWTGGGIYSLWKYRSDPAFRAYGFDADAQSSYLRVTQPHPILGPYGTGEAMVFETSSPRHDYAWFDFYEGSNGSVLAIAGNGRRGDIGPAVAVDERGNNRHVLLSLHGASAYAGPEFWTPAGAAIFRNAVRWSEGAPCSGAAPVDFALEVTPPSGTWTDTFRVRLRAKNVGHEAGEYVARLRVNGASESEQRIPLAPGEIREVSFTLSRGVVGTYRILLGPHEGVFTVQPPIITVDARTVDGAPLAGATVSVALDDEVSVVGETNEGGALSFPLPAASPGPYWLIIRALDVAPEGRHYFLTKQVTGDSETSVSFEPTAETTATIDVRFESAVEGQVGRVYLRRVEMTTGLQDRFGLPVGSILVDAANYSLFAESTVEALDSTWSYRTALTSVDLRTVHAAAFPFGGPLQAGLTWIQVDVAARVDWFITDGYGNPLDGVFEGRVGGFAAGSVTNHTPFLSLWDPNGGLLSAGYLEWSQRPVVTLVPKGATLAFVHVDLEAGPVPFDNLFDLTVNVLDRDGRSLPAVAATAGTTVRIEGTARRWGEPIPIALTINGIPVEVDAGGSFSWTVNLTEGLNPITIAAEDLAGHEKSVRYVIQSKLGVLLVVASTPEVTNVPQIAIEGLVEPGGVLTINGLATTYDNGGSFRAIIALHEGANTIVVAAEDAVGNRREIVREVTLDTVPPELEIVFPAQGYTTVEDAIVIHGRADSAARLAINGEPVAVTDGGFAFRAALREGPNVFLIEASDSAGNVQRTVLVVDRGSPYLWPIIGATGAGLACAFIVWRMRARKRVGTARASGSYGPR